MHAMLACLERQKVGWSKEEIMKREDEIKKQKKPAQDTLVYAKRRKLLSFPFLVS